jgi:hypothetical protein
MDKPFFSGPVALMDKVKDIAAKRKGGGAEYVLLLNRLPGSAGAPDSQS